MAEQAWDFHKGPARAKPALPIRSSPQNPSTPQREASSDFSRSLGHPIAEGSTSLRAEDTRYLQRHAGNQAVVQLVADLRASTARRRDRRAGYSFEAIGEVVVQRDKCNCGKPHNKHKNTCPRHPANLAKKNKETQTQHRQNQSFINLNYYESDFVQAHSVSEAVVKRWSKETRMVIHGHHSGNPSEGRHPQTTKDCQAFMNWFRNQ